MIIAVDGLAASGKSTVAKAVAKKMSYEYMDTGAMYRALTWKALEKKVDIFDEEALVRLANLTRIYFSNGGKVFVDGVDVTEEIRSPRVSNAVSIVSRVPDVRRIMVKQQRAAAKDKNVVVEGRDIGTVVFPEAEVKIFLTAVPRERARRRKVELEGKGHRMDVTTVEREIISRDRIDSTRPAGPLLKAPDAHVIDTTDKDVEQVVEEVLKLAHLAPPTAE
ncbi:MAG: (d)CMP kinase [Actinomycetota bacterium]|nr:(d)CMP kinase [Actinomycetota bacterium]